jgi:MoxR-like ATPase
MIALRFLPTSLAENATPVRLKRRPDDLEAVHIFDADSIHAVNTALASRRPLLVKGEPGVGKSQLARAAAKELQRAFYPFAVDIQTEARDLLWHFDSIGRLAKAQVTGALLMGASGLAEKTPDEREDEARSGMAISKFLHPGPIWWAFDWRDAKLQAGEAGTRGLYAPMEDCGDHANGWVILIDEIDKAEADVPNGLLEALGSGRFLPVGRDRPVLATTPYPLVVITTNEERALPDAFLRRCVVLPMKLPEDKTGFLAVLRKRGAEHFRDEQGRVLIEEEILADAATMTWDDRRIAKERGLRPLPGQAEYMDLLRALHNQCEGDAEAQSTLLAKIRPFLLRKHGDLS